MADPSEIKLLQDELARVIADVQKGDMDIEETDGLLRQLAVSAFGEA